MFKKYRIIKIVSLSILGLLIILFSFGYWFMSLLSPRNPDLEMSTVEDLPYLTEGIIPRRGKILAVVTSTDSMGNSGRSTGYELTELSRAYYVFQANGFEVDIASPLGGKPSVVIDDEDMGVFDYAFLNDIKAQYKANHTIAMNDVIANDYEAIFFAGGKGAMYDFPDNKHIQSIVRDYYQSSKVVGAVCHGPAALVNVTLDNKRSLLENKKVSCFTNKEELLLISKARSIFPFLLEDKMVERGALFTEGNMYLEKVSHDQNLITGQNPWSTWILAETMIKQMGYDPKYRAITGEENAVKVLSAYYTNGKQRAKDLLGQLILKEEQPVKRDLIAMHGIIATMKGDIGSFYDLLRLASYAKECQSKEEKISLN